MSPEVLTRELRTILARLELVSTAPCCNYNPNGGGEPTGLPSGDTFPPHEHYRGRLASIDRGLQRRLDASEATGDTEQRDSEERKAHAWHHDARLQVLDAATKTLASLTGRTGEAPERHVGKLDTERGIEEAVKEDAPGVAADDLAARLGVSKFLVRRIYITEGLDPHDGSRRDGASDTERQAKARELSAKGVTQKQIAFSLGVNQATVSRWLSRRAA
jgi:hypothetical protein